MTFKKFKKQEVLAGYSFRDPKGRLDYRVCEDRDSAKDNAAFASDRNYSHIEMPNDWHRAYTQGFRVVKVKMRVQKGR